MTATLNQLSDIVEGRPTKLFNLGAVSEAFHAMQIVPDFENGRAFLPTKNPAPILLWTLSGSVAPQFDASGELAGWTVSPLSERQRLRQKLLDVSASSGFAFENLPSVEDDTALKIMLIMTVTGIVECVRATGNN
jgi:hypothetical protein